MILDRQLDRSARWSKEQDKWLVEDRPRYRWLYPDGTTPASSWFNEIDGALEWIKIYDRELRQS